MPDEAKNSPLSSLETDMSELEIDGAAGGACSQEIIYAKQPARSDPQSKSAERLRQPARPRSGAPVPNSLQSGLFMQQQHQQQQQQQHHSISTPVTPAGYSYGGMQSTFEPSPQLQQQQQQGFEDPSEGFDNLLELLNGSSETGTSGGGQIELPGSRADIIINASPRGQMQPQLPPPPPPPPPSASSAPPSQSQLSSGGVGKAPVSESVRLALIKKLNPQSILVDENFNTQLHNAVLQNQSRDAVDFLLCNLRRLKKLLPIINLVNSCGHTPLSLCLKMRRGDLISLLIDFDAAPTQLCGSVSERTNHFHYAFSKCLDSVASIQMVQSLISCVVGQHQSDLIGLHARDRFRKTPLDYLNHRISQLGASQPDQAAAELLAQMEWLKSYICSCLARADTGQ